MKNRILIISLLLITLCIKASLAQEAAPPADPVMDQTLNAVIPVTEPVAASTPDVVAEPLPAAAAPTVVETPPTIPTTPEGINLKDNYFTQHLFELFSATTEQSFEKTYKAEEMPSAPSLDGRVWKIGFFRYNNQGGIIEYVLDGETVMAWNELFTILNLVNPNVANIEEIKNTLTETIEKSCKGFQSNVISQTDNEILFEWGATECTPPDLIYSPHKDEFEISRIIKIPQGYWVMQYASAVPITEEKKTQWVNVISTTKLPQ